MRIGEVALMRSELSPRGARYTVRHAVALGGGAASSGPS
jgi:hypothetical protein